MDEFFRDQFHGEGDIFFWLDNEALPVNQSAFVAYANRPRTELVSQNAGNGSNSLSANKRMIQFLRKIQPAKMEHPEHDSERGHRHVINERMRRERERQNYLALHSMLPPGTKNDKNSIVKTTANMIHELRCCKQELERKNYELESNLGLKNGGTKIRVNVDNPTSGVDSMLEVLKCLKDLGSSTRSLQAEFSDQKLKAVLDNETQAERKLLRAERALSKVEESLKPAERQADPESITDEERFMFRKLGLRMKAFLLLGRRGVFDGTVENMPLHWKYRELVKIIVKVKTFDQAKKIALALEAESGGVLVSVDKISKGYAMVVYRGKDYQRPSTLRPKNLLTKRKALARSIELQRQEALLKHVATLESNAGRLRSEIEQMNSVKGTGDEHLYDKLDSAYATEDDDSEDEGDEAYLETYAGGNDNEDEIDNSTHNLEMESDFPYHAQDQESETELMDSESEAYTVHSTYCASTDIVEEDNSFY